MASRQLPFGSAKLRDLEVINRETIMKKLSLFAASVSGALVCAAVLVVASSSYCDTMSDLPRCAVFALAAAIRSDGPQKQQVSYAPPQLRPVFLAPSRSR